MKALASGRLWLAGGLAAAFCLNLGAKAAMADGRVENRRFDAVVVEATPGGIAMAVRAAREGLNVLLVNRTQHLGGILTRSATIYGQPMTRGQACRILFDTTQPTTPR